MPTILPVRRSLSAEQQDLADRVADRLAAVDRLVAAARLDPEVRLRALLRARLDLWLIRRQARRLADRFPDQQS